MDDIHPLRAFRERRGLSRPELAGLLRKDVSTVWRWETGKRKISEDELHQVAEVTGIAPRVLRPDLAELMKRREPA